MKRNLITIVFVILLCVVGVGFYRGWFALSKSSPDSGSNKVNINLMVDTDKIKADAETVKEKTTELTGQAKEVAKKPGNQATDVK